MTTYEIVTTGLASIAVGVSLLSLWKSTQASSDTFKLSQGMNELELKNMITGTKQRVADITIQMLPLVSKSSRTPEEDKQLEGYKHVLNSAIEDNVNAYEEACAKYLDGKIDKVRFRKTYVIEIRQLVHDNNHRHLFDPLRSRYQAVLKVFDEWENLER